MKEKRTITLVQPGEVVVKFSGKPFKSGSKTATVKGIIDHPIVPGKQAYTFSEDDSFVSIEMCKPYNQDNML
jgi:hypothetical protein